MNHISLFNGIGGFQLAAQWMGWENVASVEIDPFCNRVTKHHFPDTVQHQDIYDTDFTIYQGRIDIITGGFPCQPFSVAGKRAGEHDNRHLWPQMFRAIKEVRPPFVVAENVPGLLTISEGMVFEQVCSDLESEGYEVQTFVLPACAVDAPHRRDRVWIVAYSESERGAGQSIRTQSSQPINGKFGGDGDATNTSGAGWEEQRIRNITNGTGHSAGMGAIKLPGWDSFPTQPPVCSRNDGFPAQLDGITFPKWRAESIKAYGNAIVPQLAYQIFKAIESTI